MSEGSNSGDAPKEYLAHPLLLEVQAGGRIIWMSQRAREILGAPENVSDLVLRMQAGNQPGRLRFQVFSWQFWRVWETGVAVLMAARPPQLPDRLQAELRRLEMRLLRSFVRLTAGERRLSDRAGRRRGGTSGRKAIRQVELERRRLGRDLHTGVGQAQAAIRLQVELINAEIPLPPPKVKQALEHITALSAGALEQVRSLSRRLHPPEWQRLTLQDALRQLWDMSGIPQRFAGELRMEPLSADPAPEITALLYRTMQEAMSNLVRYSKATRVDAELRADGDRALLKISDNGVGFDVAGFFAAPASVTSGIGLRSIREQVTEAGGNFDMESGPLGTTLVVSVALNPKD